MTRLAKYIKPYLVLLIVAIALLFVQAYANLALPNYMADIVNVGIQQGGVENAAPNALRKSTMERLKLFMSADNGKRVLADYELIQPGSPASKQYLSRYPVLAKEAIYVRRNIDSAELDAINPIMGRAWMVVSGIEEAQTNPAAAKMFGELAGGGPAVNGANGTPGATGAGSANGALPGKGEAPGNGGPTPPAGFDLSKLPAGVSPFTLLQMLPAQRRAQIAQAIDKKFAAMGPKMIVQAAARPVRDEYAALGVNISRLQTSYMLRIGALMLLLTLIAAAAAIATGFISARVASGLARDLRAAIFERVESFGAGEFDKFSTASLITRSTNDIMQIQMVSVMLVTMVFYAPIIGVGGIIRAFQKSTSMWWIIALAVAVLLTVVLSVYKLAVPKFKLMQRLMDRLNLVSRETLSGMMVIRAFNRQEREEKRFDEANVDLTNTMLFVNRVMVVMMPVMMMIMNGIAVLIIWIGSKQVAASNMQVGDMMAFMQYAMQIVFAFLMLSMMFIMLPRAAVSAGRVADVLETDPRIKDPESSADFDPQLAGTIEFRNVSFRYPGAEADVLHDITFTARPGQTTAFIGATGAGKSTLVNLIPRFYDVTGGAIYVGGRDVRSVSQHDLRDKIGYVPQKATLFAGTIATNLRYADEQASEETIATAARISQASEFIETFPDKMEADISQGGMNVSGGQKQRLSIARALVKNPPIYIFDDSFSALDFKTDAALRRALKVQTVSTSVLIVTQRVSTIKNADQIVVLDEGRVVGSGNHRELMESCETYREIATSQLTKEELE